jgi:hypothetical protein
MAVTISRTYSNFGQIKVVATFDLDGTVDFTLPRIFAATLEVIASNFGGGEVGLQAASDGANYTGLAIIDTTSGILAFDPLWIGFYNYRLVSTAIPTTVTATIIANQIP